MRKIEFRAWDTKRNTYDHEELLLAPNGDILASRWQELREPESVYIIESFTGLKDKNGREIYIGDIVSERHGDIIGNVVQKPSGEYRIAWLGIYGGDSSLYDHRSLCEVIGNIHETPGLLVEVNDVD